MPTRNASATWEGKIMKGKGSFAGESGAIAGDYSFGSRFADAGGTNPEELLAAAEAACFSMALSGNLERAGMTPERIETKAACTIEKAGDGFRITAMKLAVRARVPGADRDAFKDVAQTTKDTCPVSVALLGNVEITVDAQLE
jgi:osmotically inducible protein OsmC